MNLLNSPHIGWDDHMSEEMKQSWIDLFTQFAMLQTLQVSRSVVPDKANLSSMHLLCLSDAAEIGAAIYVGFKLDNGSYSCQLLASKSKIATHTIPRNKLCCILLMAELAYIVKNASPIPP